MRNAQRPARWPAGTVVVFAMVLASTVQAQTPSCRVVCAPTVDLMPALLRTHLFGGPRVQKIPTGEITRLHSLTNLEIIMAVPLRPTVK